MFDSVLGHGTVPKSRFGTGAVVSVLLHVGVLGLAIYLSTHKASGKEKDIAVVLKVAPPPPPPPPPASSSHKEKKTPKKNQLVQPKEIPKEKPPEAEPDKKDEEDAVEGGVEGGVKGGVVGGVVGGTLGGTGTGTVAFGEGMTRPVLISGPGGTQTPQYTSEARAAEIDGIMIVKCVISPDGSVNNCQILKPLPHMDAAVLQWLAGAKYTPVTFQGHPQAVSYVFNFRFKLSQN
jgi:periplasmic protein TonB